MRAYGCSMDDVHAVGVVDRPRELPQKSDIELANSLVYIAKRNTEYHVGGLKIKLRGFRDARAIEVRDEVVMIEFVILRLSEEQR